MIKKFFLFLFYPIIFFLDILRFFSHIKFCKIHSSSFGAFIDEVEGFSKNKNVCDELKNCKIIFFLEKNVSNMQIKKMSQRLFKIYNYNLILDYILKFLSYHKNDLYILVFDRKKYFFKILKSSEKKNTQLYFTQYEIDKGLNYLKHFGLEKNAKWVCINNRDNNYQNVRRPGEWRKHERSWNYHSYRNFSIQSLSGAAKVFVAQGYYVFRMGKYVNEKFNCQDSKIIDYANSDISNDFLDVFLLANNEFYIGSDSGIMTVPIIFKKPAYLINTSSTLLNKNYSGNNSCIHIFKRLRDKSSKKLLSLNEILQSEFANSASSSLFQKHNIEPLDNSEEDIKQLAVEICKINRGEPIETKEDKIHQEKFWHIYFNKIDKKITGNFTPKISPSFLRNNLDLLN